MRKRRAIVPIEQRLWAKVIKAGENECWLWNAHCNACGYGTIQLDGRSLLAHRVVYEITHGSIPVGMNVLHRCDNPACCNPAHLWLGSQVENIADMNAKGRNGNVGRGMTAESIAKREATYQRTGGRQKLWETRRKNNPNWRAEINAYLCRARAVRWISKGDLQA